MEHIFEERNHIENLLNTRFNFFIAIFASIIAAVLAVKNPNQLRFIIVVGFIIESLLAIVIGRAQLKLKIYLLKMRKNREEAEYFGNRVANTKNKNPFINGSRNSIIGKYLPSLISFVLLISICFSTPLFNLLNKNNVIEQQEIITQLESRLKKMENSLNEATKATQNSQDKNKKVIQDSTKDKGSTMHNSGA